MRSLQTAAVVVLVTSISAAWTSVGPDIEHDTIEAAALDFEDQGHAPLIAYGFADGTADTSIDFCRLNSSAGSWSVIATHTPEFAQPYGDFAFHERNGTLYLGLRIEEEAFTGSSVLRGGSHFDGFEGCYAFSGWTWDYDVSFEGNIRLISSPDNESIQLSTYEKSGWTTHPASDTWDPFTTVTPIEADPSIFEIVATQAGADGLAVAYSVNGSSRIALTTLGNSTSWKQVGEIEGAVSPAVAWAGNDSSSVQAAAAVTPTGCVIVWASQASPRRARTAGSPLCVLAGVAADAAPQIAFLGFQNEILVASRDAADPTLLRTVLLSSTGDAVVAETSYRLPAAITGIRVKSATALGAPHALVTFGDPTGLDGLRLLEWT